MTKPSKKSSTKTPAKKQAAPRKAPGKAAEVVATAQETIAAAGGQHIGSLIYWNPSTVDVARADARALFAAANFEKLIPEELTHASALTRAAQEAGKPRGMRIDQFKSPNPDTPVAYGVYRLEARKGETGDGHTCGARVRIDALAGEVVALPPEGAEALPEALTIATAIATKANRLVTHVASKDVSSALVSAAHELAAVPLREQGGVYLLPPSSEARWLALEERLRAIGFRASTIRMHDAPENMRACAEAAQGAIEAELSQLAADLADAQERGMRVGTIENRMESLAALKGRTELYRNVLEGLADELAAEASKVEAAFAEQLDKERAALAAKGKEAPAPGTAAARGSDAAKKAWETRRARAAAATPEAPVPAEEPALPPVGEDRFGDTGEWLTPGKPSEPEAAAAE